MISSGPAIAFECGSRLDWGFGNPNKTAALIAMLMIAVWALAFVRKFGFWTALVLWCGLGTCLVLTSSRGGVVALLCGLVPLLIVPRRPWLLSRWTAMVAACLGLAWFAKSTAAGARYKRAIALEDKSVLARGAIYKQVPRMMFDAPWGWGLGNAAQAYMQWYQPDEDGEVYKNLLNSHFTWMVEMNWPMRFTYVFGWMAALLVCWPSGADKWRAIPFGILVSFAASACFSAIAESPWLWVLPAVSLAMVFVLRIRRRDWPKPVHWIAPFSISMVLLVGLFVYGWLTPTASRITGSPGTICIGNRAPEIWIIAPDRKIVGDHYGHAIRNSKRSIGVVTSSNALPPGCGGTLVLMGRTLPHTPLASFARILIFNPAGKPEEWLANRFTPQQQVMVIWGEFLRRSERTNWESVEGPGVQWRFIKAAGCANYIPDWLPRVESFL